MSEAYIYDAIRTPRGRGKKTGALYEVKPIQLLAALLNALKARTHFDPTEIDDVIIGNVTPISGQGGNIARAATLYLGWENTVSGFQLNKLCASGLEALNIAATKIRSGWDDLIIAGGVESMSRVPMGSDGGALWYDPAVSGKIGFVPQGISADLIATIEGFSRENLDEYAYLSQKRAIQAFQNEYFKHSIIPIKDINNITILENDETPRETTLDELARLSVSFAELGNLGYDSIAIGKYPFIEYIEHLHTAGNSSQKADGAALLLVGNKEKGKALGLKPRAKIKIIANQGTEPTMMLQAAAPSAKKALKKLRMNVKDIDLWEMNEAFASAILKFQREMNIETDRMNVNGGAIALGHPLGATGAILVGTLLDELERRDKNIGMVTICTVGGMGVSTVIERV